VDSRWAALRNAAKRHGVRACWSIPVVSSREEQLGTFAVSHCRPVVAKQADIKQQF
jgi:GAF domain-containing protein